MKQFEVTAKIRNNLLKERRGDRTVKQLCQVIGCTSYVYSALENLRESPLMVDFQTIRERGVCVMCGDAALRPMPMHRYLCRTHYDAAPSNEDLAEWFDLQPKRWRKPAQQIAAYYEVEPEELFPADVLLIRKRETAIKLDATEILALRDGADVAKLLVGDVMDPEAAIARHELERDVDAVLRTLTPREESIIKRRFGLAGNTAAQTLIEVGDDRDIAPERVRQIEAKALRKLRHPSRSRRLLPYLGEDTYRSADDTDDEL